jgi:hypothetical protein
MATTISTDKVFRKRQKVVAAVDLPGVPAGTPGKVYYVAGVTWIRYHVLFENGVELSTLDAAQLADRKEWTAEQERTTRAAALAERDAERARRRQEALANLADGPGGH